MGRLTFARTRRADVAILRRNLEFWPEFRELIDQYVPLEIETIKTPINLRHSWQILRNLVVDRTSVGYASMGADLETSGAKLLLAVDQTSEAIERLGLLVPEVRQVLIPHGSQKADILRKYNRITFREGRVLCVWGESDKKLYREEVPDGVECRVVGSLRNAFYLREHPLVSRETVQHQLLFVSQYSESEDQIDSTKSPRLRVLSLLKYQLHRYCVERRIPLTIALRPPVSASLTPAQTADEIRHYRRVFDGLDLQFTDPRIPYATYLASDHSDVTVGVPSGALTESFARGNKVLMFRQDPNSGSYFGFPLEGPWVVNEGDYGEFAKRLDALRATRRQDFADLWRVQREYMVANADSDEPINLVRNLIARVMRGDSL
jgi:surface carbohydrate biosynthesis protein